LLLRRGRLRLVLPCLLPACLRLLVCGWRLRGILSIAPCLLACASEKEHSAHKSDCD
jgi:hypothetical protein